MKDSSDKEKVLTAVRLEPAIIERIDGLRPKLSTSWFEATRSDVLRALIEPLLAEVEKNPEVLDRVRGRSGPAVQGSEPVAKAAKGRGSRGSKK